MNLKKTALLLGGIMLLAALWLRWWLQPERQIPRAQARLLSNIEKRDFTAMAAMVAEDYRDRWQHDKAIVMERSREVFGQFVMLTAERESRGLRRESGRWFLTEKVRFKGLGGPLAMLARDAVNALREPFVTEWQQRSWKPWDWELESVAQPELEMPQCRAARTGNAAMKWLHSACRGASIEHPSFPMRIFLLILVLASSAFAQRPGSNTGGTSNPSATPTPTPTPTPATATRNLWTCTLPGGTYQVLVSAILSVSSHEYVVDGAARVTEVNLDTAGQFAVRFYYIEPAVMAGPGGLGAATFGKVQSILSDAADRAGTDAWKKVVKSYPTTTHARTIEYRVSSKDSLTKIFTSASNSQATGKPDTVTVSD